MPTVRLVLAMSLDGRIALSSGGKANIGGKGDREALEKALSWSDATLMGSGTLNAHESTCLIHNQKLINQRGHEKRSSQPISIIVSQKAAFSEDWAFFKQPISKWILTPNKNHRLIQSGFDRHLIMEEKWTQTLNKIYNEGISKIVLLGGMKLISSLLLEDRIDELQLTFSPKILAGKYTWTHTAINNLPVQLTQAEAWKLKDIKDLGANEVMLSYIRNRF
ncbi:5-amino-6-(5-phosphoribosylamino)uracil reductase [Prochlorococcus sp. MIT 0602]|uniref:RibD family protein n=1 Tax=Prochlorococcus sp. MIT 0602 TaxID=1499499 RepID=UPI0005339348|nr:RibD family protein [Prochlorococcus sp. MIT 0602]KGG16830.1 5-amino-6-(5-phosphoribosylamino)uracil reductase [Prochlorococcus sp. MIT 0602]KGG18196.1 5-amino-6-(5-phosphoribosylamino)uracil reductase [Prochlorococcus sp. MIT 0603]